MPKTYQFRVASMKDIDELYEVMQSTRYIEVFHGGKPRKVVISELEKELFDPGKDITVIVCEINDDTSPRGKRVVGYSIFGPYSKHKKPGFPEEEGKYAYSFGTGVHKDFQRKGVGTQIRNKTDEIAKEKGFEGMYTDVASTNHASLRVQGKAGFTKIAEIDDPRRAEGVKSVIFKKEF